MDITTPFLILIPIVVGLVQVAKITGMTTRWAPLLSVVLGVAGAWLIGGHWAFASATAIQGLVAGLSAAGLWSGVKTSFTSTAVTQ